MKSVNVKYFASLREAAGQEQESFSTGAATYGDLYAELSSKHSFPLPLKLIQVAVNDEFTSLAQPLKDGDRIVFIPPVAGG
ncbi:MAG: molybdopterin converting factor subunit 1 [Proteobacteria bacterium]|nr:MAG: molybdopterin converting factor subunit 1 [Pseudomonadota bacterium]